MVREHGRYAIERLILEGTTKMDPLARGQREMARQLPTEPPAHKQIHDASSGASGCDFQTPTIAPFGDGTGRAGAGLRNLSDHVKIQ